MNKFIILFVCLAVAPVYGRILTPDNAENRESIESMDGGPFRNYDSGRTNNEDKVDILSDQFIDFINSLHTTWKAGRNFPPKTRIEVIRLLMGVHKNNSLKLPPSSSFSSSSEKRSDIPKEFDARTKWSYCSSLHSITDQGPCGSCYAIASASTISDRLCIASSGALKLKLSAENIISCCNNCGKGCNGGDPGAVWQYYVEYGIVTGGDYGSTQGCSPYEIAPCGHKNEQLCEDEPETPSCKYYCQRSYSTSYKDDKHFGKSAYQMSKDVKEIQNEIISNGPVTASVTVFADFLNYKSGVYQHVIGESLGDHAVKLIGWGVENGVDYWLAANSWSKYWGDNGYFKILRGTNECGIEGYVIAGMPKV